MPGAYAHLTLVHLASSPVRLAGRVSPETAGAVALQSRFCQLGAVSPDYPYLAVGHPGAKAWADAMHYSHTAAMLRSGATRVAGLAGPARRKCLAWLLGYASHVVADATIHPVVELAVGAYQGREKEHRVCEFHQDAYIWQRMNLGDVGLSEYLKAGIARCTAPDDDHALDGEVAALWSAMLQETNAEVFSRVRPDMDDWHRGFMLLVDKIAEEGDHLLPFLRELLVSAGITYPAPGKVDRAKYIDSLEAPGGTRLGYDAIFDRALENVLATWAQIDASITGSGTLLAGADTWNLDTGRDESGALVFWG